MLLPCSHEKRVIAQIEPTKNLLTNLNMLHPDVLTQHNIQPEDYHEALVFRSAIESMRGRFIASSTPQRQSYVAAVLGELARENRIERFETQTRRERHDITVLIRSALKRMAAIEVKGGEGNSINISQRPLWADEFLLWCHLDGAIVNQPEAGIAAIVFNRVVPEMVRRGKRVDAVMVKDVLCGSPVRPCPKYGMSQQCNDKIAPDVYLLPQRIPVYPNDPEPPVHTRDTLELPFLILDHYGVKKADFGKHVYEVAIRLVSEKGPTGDRVMRVVTVSKAGTLLATRKAGA
ncbi:MAG: hypothetical protein HYX78_07520 [Armatimonadetes bacterium]|nr:hypothetical protein [Armatimonadota bacterium]